MDDYHMRYWDESMFAVNTYEMIENGKFFSLYYDGMPDLYNTKPQLTIWLQVIFVKLFGYSEMSLRLPSVLAATLTVVVVFKYLSKRLDYVWAWVSVLILLTAQGFIGFHTARTADSDSLLTFFLIVANLFFIEFFIDKNKKLIVYFFIFITLAFLTKSFAALLFVPGYMAILIFYKRLKSFVLNKWFLIGVLFFMASTISVILIRELETPGYINQLLNYDASRLFNSDNTSKFTLTYYWDLLYNSHFSYWMVLFIVGTIMVVLKRKSESAKVLIPIIFLVISYLSIISLSEFKRFWYDMPILPIISILAAFPIVYLIKNYNSETVNKNYKTTIIIILIFIYPLMNTFDKSQSNRINAKEKKIEASEIFIFNKINENKNLDGIKVYYHGWNGSLLFYKYKLKESNQLIELCRENTKFNKNDKVLVSKERLENNLLNTYDITLLDELENAKLYLIN